MDKPVTPQPGSRTADPRGVDRDDSEPCGMPCEQHEDCDRPCIRPEGHDGRHECKNHAPYEPDVEGTEPRPNSEDETCTDGYCSACGAIALYGADYCENHIPAPPEAK